MIDKRLKSFFARKVASMVLVVTMLLMLMPLSGMKVYAEDGSVAWDVTTKTLTFTGSGELTQSAVIEAFEEHEDVTNVVISGYSSIGSDAFSYCEGLTSITIPVTVTSIGEYAFVGCTGLTSITIPDGVTNISNRAFSMCTGLTNITIPEGVTCIDDYAFYGCTGLTSITIPKNVTTIGDYAFGECSGLVSISVEAGNGKYDSRNNCNAIIETSSNKLITGCKNTTIPNSMTAIGEYAFAECAGLTSITIPNGVTTIGDCAFIKCSGITSITIPASVTTIGEYVFDGCTSIESFKVEAGNARYDCRDNCNAIIETSDNKLLYGCKNTTIPNGVTSIGTAAFYDCASLTSITVPASVTIIEDEAFVGCTSLNSITFESSTLPTMEDYVFSNVKASGEFKVPSGISQTEKNKLSNKGVDIADEAGDNVWTITEYTVKVTPQDPSEGGTNGATSEEGTAVNIPKTGDSNYIWVWLLTMIAGLGMMRISLHKSREESKCS